MIQISRALLWAAAIIGLALAASAGLVDREVAGPMFLAVPVLALLSLGTTRSCAPCAGEPA